MQHVVINDLLCKGCEICVNTCPTDGVYMRDGLAVIDESECTVCGLCIPVCPYRAISFEDIPE